MAYTYDWKVKIGDVDSAAILYYPRLFEQVQRATEDIFNESGYSLFERAENGDFNMPVVHAEADYEKPVRHGQTVTIEVTTELGESSILFTATGIVDDEVVFEALQKNVTIGPEFTAIPIPADMRASLERYSE